MSVEPYAVREGLAVYRIGTGAPVLLMPGPHRFQRPGLRTADPLIARMPERFWPTVGAFLAA